MHAVLNLHQWAFFQCVTHFQIFFRENERSNHHLVHYASFYQVWTNLVCTPLKWPQKVNKCRTKELQVELKRLKVSEMQVVKTTEQPANDSESLSIVWWNLWCYYAFSKPVCTTASYCLRDLSQKVDFPPRESAQSKEYGKAARKSIVFQYQGKEQFSSAGVVRWARIWIYRAQTNW